jgi:hypothetical protein
LGHRCDTDGIDGTEANAGDIDPIRSLAADGGHERPDR